MADLLAVAADLVAIPSLSHAEAALADHVQARLSAVDGLEVTRCGDNVVARSGSGSRPRVVLAGHLDTVAPNGNDAARTDGDTLWGIGSADMKGGLAVMLDLASNPAALSYDVTWVFYVAEEVAREHNGLLALARERPDLLRGTAAIVCEPTDCAVEAGCQGVLRAELTVNGARAHVARPWAGSNAVHGLAGPLRLLAGWPPRRVEIDGCTYQESLQAVRVWGGVASNVLPDAAGLEISYRFAPDRDVASAAGALRGWLAPALQEGASLRVTDSAPAAPPGLSHPLLGRLVAASGRPVTAKLGWTDVAFFAERGAPAANFGPGDPELAHAPGENVTRSSLECARRALGAVLSG